MPYDPILELMSPPGHPDLFILGAFARRVTVYSQQVRAINLIDAIHFYRRPLENLDIAIIGAGVAGLTAAAKALEYGAKVTLFEQNESVLSIQHNSRHRWLHPTIYDWPFVSVGEGGVDDSAQLNVMNWSATPADQFVSKLTKQWDAICKKYPGRIFPMIPATVKSVSAAPEGYEIGYEGKAAGSPGLHTRSFPLVIFAVGFGLEPRGKGRNSYWEQDPLDQISRSADQVVLVAGYGDGALTDLMRVCLRNFEHEEVLAKVVGAISSAHRDKIKDIERDKRRGNAEFLSKEYRSLDFPEVQAVLSDLVVQTRKVFLTGSGDNLFDPRASTLNRLVVSQLLWLGAFTFIPMKPEENFNFDFKDNYDATIEKLQDIAGTAFSDVVLRFGPDPAIAKIGGLPGLAGLRKRWESLQPVDDPTLIRFWERFTPISEYIERSCVIIRAPDSRDDGDLLSVAKEAIRTLQKTRVMDVKPVAVSVHECIRSDESLCHAVRTLCRAPIAIFALGKKMGQENPAGMMLLGIRAAVRRGLTLVIHEGKITDWSALPFNLKELHVLSLETSKQSAGNLANFIADGLSALAADAAGYRDLPVFDIVRRPRRRTPLTEPGTTEAFVLCSFGEKYTEKIWNRLDLLLRAVDVPGGALEPKRVIDYASPLLVGERLYELTRFAGLCVVDWTEWRANVFFELGVRLAVNPVPPICVLNRGQGNGLTKVKRGLMNRFTVLEYSLGRQGDDQEFKIRFADEMQRGFGGGPGANPVYFAAQKNIFLAQEYHDLDLLRHVDGILGPDVSRSGRLPLLYGGNPDLLRQVWGGSVEALKAAQLLVRWKIENTNPSEVELDLLGATLRAANSKLGEFLDLGFDERYNTFGEGIDDD